MPKANSYDKLLEVFRNPTKLSVLMLLSEGERLTVTQMSKIVGVSKPNLYHFVAEMVKDRILNEPETRVKRNFVEKYYSMNKGIFEANDPVEQSRRFNRAPRQQQREILLAWLASMSLYLRLRAERIERIQPAELSRLLDDVHDDKILLEHVTLGEHAFNYFLDEIRRVRRTIHERWKNELNMPKGNVAVILAVPALLATTDIQQK